MRTWVEEVNKRISMKCFESFFKHTWRPQQVHQVDPPSRFEPTTTKKMHQHAAGETTELGEVVIATATSSVATSPVRAGNDEVPCKNGGCKIWRSSRGSGSESRSESPWHSLKTIFLVSVIAAFLLWIIVYTLLDQYRIL